MNAALRFTRGILKMPLPWQLWLLLLVTLNFIAPLFFIDRVEAQVVIGVFLVGGILMMVLTALVGFTRLLGLGHVLWFPLLYFLWTRLDPLPPDGFGIWEMTPDPTVHPAGN